MFFHITIHKVEAREVLDHPCDPFDQAIELYQTWHLAELEDIDATKSCAWARQGSSTRGSPDDGVTLRRGDSLLVVDPQITLGIPDEATKEGSKKQYRLDFHHWDSDGSTEKVRSAFTDITLKYMISAFREAQEDAEKARQALTDWISGNWKDAARAIAAASAASGPWTKVGMDLLPMLDLLVDIVRKDSDDYIQLHRFTLQFRGTGSGVEWQITDPSGVPSGWRSGTNFADVTARAMDGTGETVLEVAYRFRLVGDK